MLTQSWVSWRNQADVAFEVKMHEGGGLDSVTLCMPGNSIILCKACALYYADSNGVVSLSGSSL